MATGGLGNSLHKDVNVHKAPVGGDVKKLSRPPPPLLYSVRVLSTDLFANQRPGPLGFFQPKSAFNRKRFTENYLQSVFDALGSQCTRATVVVGGDGSSLAGRVARLAARIAAGNGVSCVISGVNARFTVPALSGVMRDNGAVVGFYLAGDYGILAENERHEEEFGEEEEFGIQVFDSTGGLATEEFNEIVFKKTRYITKIRISTDFAADIFDAPTLMNTFVEGRKFAFQVVDPLEAYMQKLEAIFELDYVGEWLGRHQRRVVIGVGGGVMGDVVRRLFIDRLGMDEEGVLDIRGWRKDDQVGDVAEMAAALRKFTSDFGVSLSPDGRRHLFMGTEGHVVSPGEALVLVAAYSHLVRGIPRGVGFARTVTTGCAIDAVAKRNGVEMHVTPPGWRHFGSLLEGGRACLFGSDSFEMGGDHVRAPDAIWTVLAMMTAVAKEEDGLADWTEPKEEAKEEENLAEELAEAEEEVVSESYEEGDSSSEEAASGEVPEDGETSEVPPEEPPEPPLPERMYNPLRKMLQKHWDSFGRHYSLRLDYDACPPEGVLKMMDRMQMTIRSLNFISSWYHCGPHSYQVVRAQEFEYVDPVELTVHSSRCFRIIFHDGSTIVVRACTSEVVGCGVRLSIDSFEDSVFKVKFSREVSLQPLVDIAKSISGVEWCTGKSGPTARV